MKVEALDLVSGEKGFRLKLETDCGEFDLGISEDLADEFLVQAYTKIGPRRWFEHRLLELEA